jgi:hypothetical protein
MSKEHFIAAHEELIAQEMDETGCSEDEAYTRTIDMAWLRMNDRLAGMADHYRDIAKDCGL